MAARGPGGWLLLAHTQPFPRVPCTHSTLLAIQVTPLWSPLWCLAAALLNVPAVLVLASRRSAAWCESEELRAEVPEAWHPPPWRAPQRIEHRSVNGAFLWLFTNALLFPMRFCRQAAVVPLLLAINFTLMPGICKQFHAALPAAHCLAVAALRALATMALCMAASYYLELRARRSWVLRGWQRGSARGGG